MSHPIMWHYITLGSPDNPAIVFLHGFLGRGSDWLPVAREFEAAHHILLPDLPGHGENGDPDPATPLAFENLAGELARTLDSAGVRKSTLVGYSLGGRLALHFAARYPDRLAGLVLESASPGLRSAEERESRRILDDERAARLLKAGLPAFLENWYRADLWASLRRHPKRLRELIADRSSFDPALASRVIADLSPGRMTPMWDRLPRLSMPVLLLSGDLDAKYTAITTETAGLIPEAVHVRIDDAGHNIHFERPGRFVVSLKRFLEQV